MFNKKASKKALFRFPCNQFPFRKKKGTFPRPVPGRGKAGFRRLPPGLRAGQGLGCRRASREAAQGWETRRRRGLGPETPPREPGGGTRLGDRAGPGPEAPPREPGGGARLGDQAGPGAPPCEPGGGARLVDLADLAAGSF